jgi:hypothetical protein
MILITERAGHLLRDLNRDPMRQQELTTLISQLSANITALTQSQAAQARRVDELFNSIGHIPTRLRHNAALFGLEKYYHR